MFAEVVDTMAYGALIFSIVEIYLMLNKLWSRKHIRAVAESISVSSRIIGLIPLSIFTLNYALHNQWQGVIEGSMWLVAGIVQLLIGIGLWVSGMSRSSLWSMIKRSIRKERAEVTNLASSIFSQQSRHIVIDVLAGAAMIDGELKDSEKNFIDGLANKWNTRLIWGAVKARYKKMTLSVNHTVHEDIHSYLKTNPQLKEVKSLRTTVKELMLVDGALRDEEEALLNELDLMIDDRYNRGEIQGFTVAIVPQSVEQEFYLESNITGVFHTEDHGGKAFVTRQIYSKEFAEGIKNQFQNSGYFTAVVSD